MKLTVVTPNLNGMPYLPRCIASVRDQAVASLAIEHWVVDGGSRDGSVAWLSRQASHSPGYTLQWLQEPDSGMYDAIDKGWRRATGDWLAWLNSDEQYLPGALRTVADAVSRSPRADILCGDTLIVRPDGSLAAFRKAAPLRRGYLRTSHLYVHSSSLFVQRRWVADAGIRLDPAWRAAGDHEWILRLLAAGARCRAVRSYLSAFFLTGSNLGVSAVAARELSRLQAREPAWRRRLAPALLMLRSGEKLLRGGFSQRVPLRYDLIGDDGRRRRFEARRVSWKWVTQ